MRGRKKSLHSGKYRALSEAFSDSERAEGERVFSTMSCSLIAAYRGEERHQAQPMLSDKTKPREQTIDEEKERTSFAHLFLEVSMDQCLDMQPGQNVLCELLERLDSDRLEGGDLLARGVHGLFDGVEAEVV